eukprot:gene10179-11221_t
MVEREGQHYFSSNKQKQETAYKRATKYVEWYRLLLSEMKAVRGNGLKVNFNWLWKKARSIQRDHTKDDSAEIRKHVITIFLKRYNVLMRTEQRNHNESPMPFVVDQKRTYQVIKQGDKHSERQRKKVRKDEKNAWHPDVDVLWEENAWADTMCSDATDLWQVFDAGIVQTLKMLAGQHYQQWLDEGNNIDLWYGHEKGLTSMQRRILVTQWIGSAWNTLCNADYANLRTRCWKKTGCLMTADGSNERRKDYTRGSS